MSRGGGRQSNPNSRRGGMRFTQGPIKGLTVEQATEKARGLWSKAPDSVKEKYAGREASTLAPSERKAYRQQIAGVEPAPGMSEFSKGTRRASPGDLNGDGMQDVAQPNAAVPGGMGAGPNHPQGILTQGGKTYVPGKGIHLGGGVFQPVAMPRYEPGGEFAPASAAKPLNPAATTGAGRGTPIKAPAGAGGVVGAAGAVGAAGKPPQVFPTGKPGPWTKPEAPQVFPTGKPGPYRVPTDSPSPGGDVQVGMGANAGKINPLTGRPIGYTPPAQALPGIERPSAGMSFDPKYGAVPKATEVPEAPMTAAEYGKVKASQDVNDPNALDPTSPEASAARGRMRTFEDGERAKAAAVARRERVGPSPAERDAQQRQAARKLDGAVARGYGDTRRY